MIIKPPRISDFVLGTGIYWPQPNSSLIVATMQASGGGGCASSDEPYGRYPYKMYGKRGSDCLFLKRAPRSASIRRVGMGAVVTLMNHGFIPGQAFWFVLPPDGLPQKTYYVMRDDSTFDEHHFQISLQPYTPPFLHGLLPEDPALPFQMPVWLPFDGNCSIYTTWYGVMGGGPGGIVGDQGAAQSFWGLLDAGPDGYVQSLSRVGGVGNASWNGGGSGGSSPWGGAAGSSVQAGGGTGTDRTGAGGAGAAPGVPGVDVHTWGATGGASGSWGKVWLTPDHVNGHWWSLGGPGLGGLGTSHNGGRGAYGSLVFEDWAI